MRHLLALAALVATPAFAKEAYGPPDDFVWPRNFVQKADETTDQAKARYDHVRRDATRWEIAYQIANAADAATTLSCLSRNVCTEGNPLYGSHPNKAVLIGSKAAMGVVHWLVFAHMRGDDPFSARKMAQWSFVIQGGVVAANLRFSF